MDTDGFITSLQAPPQAPVLGVRRWQGEGTNDSILYLFVGKQDNIPTETMRHIEAASAPSAWHSSLGALTGYKTRPEGSIRFVFATVWPDDSVLYALTKVLRAIQAHDTKRPEVLPFAWNRHGILRFRWPTLKVNPETLNPWDARHTLPIVGKQPEYDPYALIGTEEVQLVLYDDIRTHGEFKRNDKLLKMYFPDAEFAGQLMSHKLLHATEEYLEQIWMSPVPSLVSTSSRIKGVVFEASYSTAETTMTIADLFEQTHATKTTQLIQWSDDTTRVMYKLYKKHDIRPKDFSKWTGSYHVPRVASIVMYEFIKGTTIRVQIQEDGIISVAYNIDPSGTSRGKDTLRTLEDVIEHARGTAEKIKELLGLKELRLKMADISYDVVSSISTVGLDKERLYQEVHDALGRALPLFFMVYRHADKNKRTMVFRRASNLQHQFSLAETVQSMLDYGIHSTDARERLLALGYDRSQVDGAMEEVALAHEEGKAVRPSLNMDVDRFMVLTLVQADGTFQYGIRHAPDTEEAKRALRWLSSIVSHTVHALLHEAVPTSPTSPTSRTSAASAASAKKQAAEEIQRIRDMEEQEQEPTMPEQEEETGSEDSWEFGGGGKTTKKTGDGYLLERLQTADELIFKNTKINYARGCQGERQPLLLSKDEWERSKTKVTNSMLYRNNYYTCPSLWCKEAGVVMTQDELKINKGLCPGTREKPIVLWDKPTDRFVGFNKNVITENGKNIYSPCCFMADQFKTKKARERDYEDLVVYKSNGEPMEIGEPKKKKPAEEPGEPGEEEPEEPVPKPKARPRARQEDEDTYILKPNVPIGAGRFGSVPLALYRIFFPQSNEPSANITTQPTIVRHGIGAHHEDSLMGSIAYVLGYKSKTELLEEMLKVLDPITFISLEGGAVLASFMTDQPPQVSYEAWKRWVDQYPVYKELMEIDTDGLHDPNDIHILRERKIYEAYLLFVEHLASNDTKNTRMLYNILARLGVLLIVWERDRTDEGVLLSCPYFMSYTDMKGLIKQFKNRYIMLLYHGSYKYPYYEPLEIRALNKPPVKEIPLEEHPEVMEVPERCPVAHEESDVAVIERLRGLIYWSTSMFQFSYRQYMPETIVISPDMRIEGVITRGSIWLGLPRPSIGVLPRLVDMLVSMKLNPRLHYHEDIDTDTVTAMFRVVNRTEYEVWKNRCTAIGFRVLEEMPPAAPIVPVVPIMPSTFEKQLSKTRKEAVAWRDNQLRIARYLLYQYDNKVAPHISKPRKDFIGEMMDVVAEGMLKRSKLQHQERLEIKTAIEEMPLIYGKESLQRWIHAITLTPYRFYDSGVHTLDEAKNNWTFSQLAVEMGLPKGVVAPSAAMTPTEGMMPEEDDVQPAQATPTKRAPESLPRMAKAEHVTIHDMPSKWKKANIKVMTVKRNRQENIPELAQWLSARLHSPFTWEDILFAKYNQILGYQGLPLADFKEAMGSLLQEPTFKQALVQVMGVNKSLRDDELLQHIWRERSALTQAVREIAVMDPNPVWPMDIDLRVMAQLYDMFVLVMFRKPYIMGEPRKKETDIENMRLSSMLYYNQNTTMERPLIMVYREKDADKTGTKPNVYSLIQTQAGSRFYYSSASDAPSEIQAIMNAHRSRTKA